MVQRLKHESDLQDARSHPVEEQLGGEDAFVEIDSLQAAAKAKDRELSRLQRELERVTSRARPLSTTPALGPAPAPLPPTRTPSPTQVDDDETLDQMGAGVRARYNSMATGGEADDADDIGGEMSYAQQQQMGRLREESRHDPHPHPTPHPHP